MENQSEIEKNTQHPSHYGGGTNPYETIKVLKEWGLDNNAYLWNVCKYISRAGKKNGNSLLQDLVKAEFYLNYYIQILQEKEKVVKAQEVAESVSCNVRDVKDAIDGNGRSFSESSLTASGRIAPKATLAV